jgi:hypothetical protein
MVEPWGGWSWNEVILASKIGNPGDPLTAEEKAELERYREIYPDLHVQPEWLERIVDLTWVEPPRRKEWV